MSINSVECLLCHTVHTESFAENPGRSWRCTRCGQRWDAARLEVVGGYQQWLRTEAATILNGAAAPVPL